MALLETFRTEAMGSFFFSAWLPTSIVFRAARPWGSAFSFPPAAGTAANGVVGIAL